MTIPTLKAKHQNGFTIVELMIATSVLSVILLLVTAMMLSMGNLFYKGINQSRVQDGVRAIADGVSQQLQLSGQALTQGTDSSFGPTIRVYCIGDIRYSYVLLAQIGHPYGGVTLPHVLWRDVPSGGCDPTHAANLTSGSPGGSDAAELDTPNSRLTSFCIGNIIAGTCNYAAASPYKISVGIAYGDDDLLCDGGTAGDCSSLGTSTHLLNPSGQILCKSQAGDQFCATSNLTTTVASRL